MNVLLVYDTPANIDILRKTLENHGLNIFFEAQRGTCYSISVSPPDLIFFGRDDAWNIWF